MAKKRFCRVCGYMHAPSTVREHEKSGGGNVRVAASAKERRQASNLAAEPCINNSAISESRKTNEMDNIEREDEFGADDNIDSTKEGLAVVDTTR
jgi:hypothetical protein